MTDFTDGSWRSLITGDVVSAIPDSVIDNFEDEDKTVASPDWSGWGGETSAGNFDVNTPTELSGDFAAFVNCDNQDFTINVSRDSIAEISQLNLSLYVKDRTGLSSEAIQINIFRSGTNIERILNMRLNGDIDDTGFTWELDTRYDFEFVFDYVSNTYDIVINGSTKGSDIPLGTTDGFDEIKIRQVAGSKLDYQLDNVEAPL